MKSNCKPVRTEDLRLDPEQRLCPMYDSVSIKKFRTAAPFGSAPQVLDNCAEEHIQ